MSAKAMGRVWDLDLPHNKRLVLLAMADHADHEGRNIYPSTDLIAWKTGYSDRQVQRVIDALIADGILVMVKKARQQYPATYDMNFAAGTIKPPFDRPQRRQNVTPQRRQNVTAEKPRGDILTQPGVTFQPSRGDIAMSPEPWNHGDQPTPPTPALHKNGDGDDFYRELRRRKVGQAKARQIAGMSCDQARILSLIDTRPNASDPNSLGRLIIDILDGVADVTPPRARAVAAPLAATRPNIPETTVAPAEMLRHARERR